MPATATVLNLGLLCFSNMLSACFLSLVAFNHGWSCVRLYFLGGGKLLLHDHCVFLSLLLLPFFLYKFWGYCSFLVGFLVVRNSFFLGMVAYFVRLFFFVFALHVYLRAMSLVIVHIQEHLPLRMLGQLEVARDGGQQTTKTNVVASLMDNVDRLAGQDIDRTPVPSLLRSYARC